MEVGLEGWGADGWRGRRRREMRGTFVLSGLLLERYFLFSPYEIVVVVCEYLLCIRIYISLLSVSP